MLKPITKPIACRVTEDIYNEIQEQATNQNLTINEYLKEILSDHVKGVTARGIVVTLINEVVRKTKDVQLGKELSLNYNKLINDAREKQG